MKKIILLLSLFFAIGSTAQIKGTWHGNIQIPNQNLPFVIHITKDQNKWKATAESPSQSNATFDIQSIALNNDTLILADSKLSINYRGVVKNSEQIKGVFTQHGMSFKLNLDKGPYKANRVQQPKEPYNYISQNITFFNEKDSITLAGTLTLPNEQGKFPAVVLVSGSGPQNRDSQIFDHQPFLVIADHLTKNGYAVLRYDDRGVAQSEGDFASASVFDFASDTKAAIKFLQQNKQIDHSKIGVLGHSEGGQVAQIIASRDPEIDFIILLASPAIKGSELLSIQKEALLRANNVPKEQIAKDLQLNLDIYDIVLNNKDQSTRELYITELLENHFKGALNPTQLKAQVKSISSQWMYEMLNFNPSDYLREINCKVLALNGTKDLQVTSTENLQGIATGLAHNKNTHIKSYQGLNHLFQKADKGTIAEYQQITTTIEPVVLEDITLWLNNCVK